MAKKELRVKKHETPPKSAATLPTVKSNKKSDDDAAEEFTGIHVINKRDIENHFGTSEIKTAGDRSGQPAADRPKADVHLQIDAQVWRQAQAAAADAKMELSEYVESALARFKKESAK